MNENENKPPSFLGGLTHAIVTVSSQDDVKETGIVATVDLCFGSNEDSIFGIRYVTYPDGTKAWESPSVLTVDNGNWISVPVFRGALLRKVCAAGARTLDRIRQDIGKPEFGTKYRVGETTEEVTA
jgi:hypothetical protein